MLAGYWRAKHSPAHRHSILAGTGSTGLVIWLPLDPLSKLLTIEHTGGAELGAGGRADTGSDWAVLFFTGYFTSLADAPKAAAILLEGEGLLAPIFMSLVFTAITDRAALPRDPARVSAGCRRAGQRLTLDTPILLTGPSQQEAGMS